MKYLFIILSLLLSTLSRSQNFVPNPSFETYTLCPTNSCNIELYASSWTSATGNSSTDYFNTCSPSCKLPTNNARTGNGYAGLFFLGASSSVSNTRDYLQVQLISPLIQNVSYYVEFFVILRNISSISACNNISANLSIIRPFTNNWGELQPLTPHIINPGNPIINDKTNWIKVSGCYTSQGGEEYLTIGNFKDDVNTQTTGTTTSTSSYYLVDDVLVEEITGSCTTGINELALENTVSLLPNPVNGLLSINSAYEINKIELSNIAGQLLLLSEPVNSKIHQLQLQDFSGGVYFVKVFYPNGMVLTRKIVKY